MKRKLLAIILAFAIIFLINGCASETADNKESSFILVESRTELHGIDIFVHKETRVMYAAYHGSQKGGLTVMIDADGKPLIWEGEL